MNPRRLRHESYLLELPFDAGVGHGLIHHVKDVAEDEREPGWAAFDLRAYLGLDSEPAPGAIASTTLMFAIGSVPARRPLAFSESAWPAVFAAQRAELSRRERRRSRPGWRRLYERARSQPLLPEVRSVVQAVRLAEVPAEADFDGWRDAQLEFVLARLNDYLVAVAGVHGHLEIGPVSRRDLSPLLAGFGWWFEPDGRRSQVERTFYIAHERLGAPVPPLSRAEADVAMWISVARDHPLKLPGELILAANTSVFRGRFPQAALEAGTAIETLVSGVVRLAGPVRGYTDAKVRGALDASFKNRTADHFAPLLGLSRDVGSSNDPLGTWWQTGYDLRNRIAHEGHRPEETSTREAVRNASLLWDEVGLRLAGDPVTESLLLPVPAELAEAAMRDRARRLQELGAYD